MPDAICEAEGCERRRHSRGLCSTHYQRVWIRGGFDDIGGLRRSQHQISNPDFEKRVGDCAVCGPQVRIRVRQYVTQVSASCRERDRGPRPWMGWRKYKITREEFEVRLQAQQGRCLVCRGLMDAPVIDHSHETGEVRGLLCNSCNSGLGFFRDDPQVMIRAAKYVRRYS